jgi:hypothetical protein
MHSGILPPPGETVNRVATGRVFKTSTFGAMRTVSQMLTKDGLTLDCTRHADRPGARPIGGV